MEKLSNSEKAELKNNGYSCQDIAEISSCIKKTSYSLLTSDGKWLTISEKEAIDRLGREDWIKAICRSAFYVETTRWGLNGERVKLHTRNYVN